MNRNNYNEPRVPTILTQYRTVDVFNPESFEPSLAEISQALGNINRYNGHTSRPFSVAEHSLNCMLYAEEHHEVRSNHALFYILLHDAAEAYTQDILRPIKPTVSQDLLDAEALILEQLIKLLPFSDEQRADLQDENFLELVRLIDTRAAVTEVQYLFNCHDLSIDAGVEAYPELISWFDYNFLEPLCFEGVYYKECCDYIELLTEENK